MPQGSTLSIVEYEPLVPAGSLSIVGFEPFEEETVEPVRRPGRVPGLATIGETTQAKPPVKPATFLDRVRDIGVTALKGAIALPEAIVGLADIPTGGRVGKALEETVGFQPQAAKQILDTYYSEQQQQANRTVREADGLVRTAIAALSNPSTIAHSVLESLPVMLAGGGIGRAALKMGAPAVAAGAVGEGAISAGAAAEQTRQQTGTLTPTQAGLAATSGATTGLLALFGGQLAAKLGIADVDTMLAAGLKDATARHSLVKAVIGGGLQEGFLEELPQSVQEQVLQNVAAGRPWEEGINEAAVMGTLAGAVMGGGSQVPARAGRQPALARPPAPTPRAAVATAPVSPAPSPAAPPAVPIEAPAFPPAAVAPAPTVPSGVAPAPLTILQAEPLEPAALAGVPTETPRPTPNEPTVQVDEAPATTAPAPLTIVSTEPAVIDVTPEAIPTEASEATAVDRVEPAGSRLFETFNEIESAAKARIQARGTFTGERLLSGLPVDDVTDLVLVGAAKIGKGVIKFGQWSREMVNEFGETIRPHLGTLFAQATKKAKDLRPVHVESGRSVVPQQAIPSARLLEFPSLQKMPKPIRQDIADLLSRFHGFEDQRRGVQPIARTQERAKDVWLPIETLRPGTALNAEELEAYKGALATALTERQRVLERIQAGEATDRDKVQFSYLTDVAVTLTASYRGAKAEAGRALNILRTKARVLDLQEARFLKAALEAPGFHRDLQQITQAAIDAAGDPLVQLRLLRQRASGTWFDYVQAAYYASLLSGVKTHLRNIIGNSFNLIANLATPLGAVPADAIRSARTSQRRTVFLGELPQSVVGGFIGLDQGLRNAAFTFRHGFRPSTVESASVGKFDTARIELPGGLVTNWPSRALEAMDELFRSVARSQELYAGAYAHARSEGVVNRQQIATRMSAILTAIDPTSDDGRLYQAISDRADVFAARAVFQEEPGPIVAWLLKAKSPTSPTALRAAALFITPFIKTPAAILRQGFEASPAGLGMKAARQGGREGAQAIGRAVLGTGFMLGPIAWLAVTGRLTGAPPEDPGDREELYAQGKLANAVKVGKYWVRYSLFQPFSVPLAAVANAWNKFKESDQSEGNGTENGW